MAMQSREAANELYQEGFADAANDENTLAEEELSGSDIVGALLKVQESIDRQAEKNEQTAEQMRQMLSQMRDVLDEVQRMRSDAADSTRVAQLAALSGVSKVQKDAEELTVKSIGEVTERNRKYIDALVLESRRRIERLGMITLPDRLFYYGKWTVLILALCLLGHAIWQIVA